MGMPRSVHLPALPALIALFAVGCTQPETTATPMPECDPDNGGLTLPAEFCAIVFADLGGAARHIVVRPDGDVFVAMYAPRGSETGGGVVALRDTSGDGRADSRTVWGPARGGTGIALSGDRLWFATNDAVMRYTLTAGSLEPSGPPDTIVSGLPASRSHAAKTVVLSGDGRVFVNIGSPSNSCQEADRTSGAPGMDPCPELETRAGTWVFDANRPGQTQADGRRWATGIRNGVAMAMNHADNRLYVMQHGRDQLAANWGGMFNEEANAEKPAEELFVVDDGDDFGWPYCFYDPQLQRKVLAPEYGGDGQTEGRCTEKEGPLFAFPAHWAPNGMLFHSGNRVPARYGAGVFIAFHGSWNRAPLPQGGYNITFLPFNAGAPLASSETFADGFAGAVKEPNGAEHRPVGMAEGPDGSIYVTDDVAGRIWRIFFRGE